MYKLKPNNLGLTYLYFKVNMENVIVKTIALECFTVHDKD